MMHCVRARIVGSLLIVLLMVTGCAHSGAPKRAVLMANNVRLTVECASTPEARATGLQFRTKLPDDHGMLFMYAEDQIMRFWMKDTYIPLDIAFLAANGTILEIYPLEPGDTAPVESMARVRFALEVNRGWFKRHGVAVGDVIRQIR